MPGISDTTWDQAAARLRCAEVYFPHRMAVLHESRAFAMSLSAVSLGDVSAGSAPLRR